MKLTNPVRQTTGLKARTTMKTTRALGWVGLSAVLLASGIAFWAAAQQQNQTPASERARQRMGEPDESPEQRAEREQSRLAVLDPIGAQADRRRHQTSEEIQQEEVANFAILQPVKYAAEFEKFKDPERWELERQARWAILNPLAHSGSPDELNQQHFLRKQRGEKDPDDILEPQFDSRNLPEWPLEKPPLPRQSNPH